MTRDSVLLVLQRAGRPLRPIDVAMLLRAEGSDRLDDATAESVLEQLVKARRVELAPPVPSPSGVDKLRYRLRSQVAMNREPDDEAPPTTIRKPKETREETKARVKAERMAWEERRRAAPSAKMQARRGAVVDVLRTLGSASTKEIGTHLGLDMTTAGFVVADLVRLGTLVIVGRRQPDVTKRSAPLYALAESCTTHHEPDAVTS